MDKLWLLTEALESLNEDIQAFRDDLHQRVFTGQYDNIDIVIERIRQLGTICRKQREFYRSLTHDCCEGVAYLRWLKRMTQEGD